MNIFFNKFEEKITGFLQKGIMTYKKIKPYLALSIFWSFYIRGFLLLPYGNIFDVNLFFSIFSVCFFLSFIDYPLFFNLTLKIIGKILSFHWSRKWLGLYHILSAHLAFFPTFFVFLFMSIGLYRAGLSDINFRDATALSEVVSQALREIGRPAFIVFFPLQLTHFLFKAFDWNAIGLDDKTSYNVIFKKPGAKNVSDSMLNFIKKLEQQGKLSIYDDRSVVLDSLGQSDKENWMVCLYNEVLFANQTIIKENKWYAPLKIILPPFFKSKEEFMENKSEVYSKPDSYLFYLSYGGIKIVIPEASRISKFFTDHSKAIIAGTAVLGTLGGAYGWREDQKLKEAQIALDNKKIFLDQKLKELETRDKIIESSHHATLELMEKKFDCSNKWTKDGVDSCNNRFSELIKQVDKQKKERLEQLSPPPPPKGGRFPYSVLEGNEVNPGSFKKCFSFLFNLFF